MNKGQLEQGNILLKTIERIEEAEKRVENLTLGWSASGCWYGFTKPNLGERKELIAIFDEVAETAKLLLQKKIESYKKQINKEFENI